MTQTWGTLWHLMDGLNTWFKTDKNSWRTRECTYNYYQSWDGATSRNYAKLLC